MTDPLSVSKVVVYLILIQPALFCLWKHGKTGFLGWFYVQLFCVLRIATGAMGIHGSGTGLTSVILNSIGLSPLLLAIAGVLHEAYVFPFPFTVLRRPTRPQEARHQPCSKKKAGALLRHPVPCSRHVGHDSRHYCCYQPLRFFAVDRESPTRRGLCHIVRFMAAVSGVGYPVALCAA